MVSKDDTDGKAAREIDRIGTAGWVFDDRSKLSAFVIVGSVGLVVHQPRKVGRFGPDYCVHSAATV